MRVCLQFSESLFRQGVRPSAHVHIAERPRTSSPEIGAMLRDAIRITLLPPRVEALKAKSVRVNRIIMRPRCVGRTARQLAGTKPDDTAVMVVGDRMLVDLARLSSLAYEDQSYVDRAWSVAHGKEVGDIADPATVQKPTKKVALDPQHLEVLKRVEITPRLFNDGLTDANVYVVEYGGDSSKDGSSIMLIFRGTDSIQDAVCDADCAVCAFPAKAGVKVHAGFLLQYRALLSRCDAAVKDYTDRHPDTAIHCSGHSLGAACSTLFALHYGLMGRPVNLTTFGSPRVGNSALGAAMKDCVVLQPRVKHGSDCVPKVPLEVMDFAHVTSETHIGVSDTHPNLPLMSDIPDHAIDLYIRCLVNGTPAAMKHDIPLHKEVVGAIMNSLHRWL